MNQPVTLYIADDDSPLAGEVIGRVLLPGEEPHTAVVPGSVPASEIHAYLVEDFETTDNPIGLTGEELAAKRARVALARDQEAARIEREAQEAEAAAAEARQRAERLNALRR